MNTYIRGHIFQTGWNAFRLCTDKQERSASDLCRWYHTKPLNLLKLWVVMSYPHKCWVYRDWESLSFPMQLTSCTAQRARVGNLDLLYSKSGGNVSTLTPDTCTAGTAGSLQKLTLGQPMLQEDALQSVSPHKQVGAEQAKQRLELVSMPLPHITAQKLKSLTGNALTPL